jgi:DNA-binding PadR family transcriptional regulator
MVRSQRSNPLALAVLVCLYERPMHPYDVAQTLRSRAKEESVRLNYGSLYAVVESLERRGLIQARETVREGRRPERTVYEITDLGSREAVEWLSDIVAVPSKEYPQFLAALTFLPALSPEEALGVLHQRANALEVRLAQMRATMRAASDAGLPRLFELEGEYELAVLNTELDFVQHLIKDIETNQLEGIEMWRSFHVSNEVVNPFTGFTLGMDEPGKRDDPTVDRDTKDGSGPSSKEIDDSTS